MNHPLSRIFAPISLIVAIAASSFTITKVEEAGQLATASPALETVVARADNP
jgi:hypothetical protein